MKLKEVVTPGSQFDMEPHFRRLIPIAFTAKVRKGVSQTPLCSPYFFPRYSNPGLDRTVTEIDHDQASVIILDPAPGDQILEAWIVGPSATLAQPPFAITK